MTIQDIAEAANLTKATISRALNNHPNISQKTKDRVTILAKELGYTPNIFARGLARKKSYLIGILGSDFKNIGLTKIACAAQEVVEKAALLGHYGEHTG